MEVVDGGDHLLEKNAVRVGVDDAHRVRDVVRDPDLGAVGLDGKTNRVDADVDPVHHLVRGRVDDVYRVGRGIDRVDEIAVDDDGLGVRARKRGAADVVGDIDNDACFGPLDRS